MKLLGARSAVLTRNDLKHTVLLHVGRKVPGSHVLLHYANIGQLLTGGKQDAHQNGGHPSQREKDQNILGGKKNFRGLCCSLFFSLSGDALYQIIIPKSFADLRKTVQKGEPTPGKWWALGVGRSSNGLCDITEGLSTLL